MITWVSGMCDTAGRRVLAVHSNGSPKSWSEHYLLIKTDVLHLSPQLWIFKKGARK